MASGGALPRDSKAHHACYGIRNSSFQHGAAPWFAVHRRSRILVITAAELAGFGLMLPFLA